jgi:hypothetical protein
VSGNYVRIDGDRRIDLGNVSAILRDGQTLSPWHQFALSLINQVIDERPIYFASSGNAAASLGLSDHLVRQGLAFRLYNGPLEDEGADGILAMQPSPYESVTGDWLDVPRTQMLMDEVFVHRTGIPEAWSHWPDLATIGIPNYYAWTYLALTQAALQTSNEEAMEFYRERSEAWSILGTG